MSTPPQAENSPDKGPSEAVGQLPGAPAARRHDDAGQVSPDPLSEDVRIRPSTADADSPAVFDAGTRDSSWEPHLSSYPCGQQEPALRDSIPGYNILGEIHRGGQGIVYQAIQERTRRRVAIKVMREGPFASQHERARFEREVHVLAGLKHPNIVAIHESGTAGGCFYFVMDYVSGQPLDEYMGSRRRGVVETLRLFKQICEAVNAAHLRGVIHRDLKPGNIRIDPNGQPQILDFGLAKVAPGQVGGESGLMTMTGQFVGSLPWASPEQAEGIPSKIDIRTDVYSLGVILYQMLTGSFPYDVTGSFREVLDRIINAPPISPRSLRAEIDDEVETIALTSLAKERERRYQSAGEFGRDIGHYLAGEPIEAKRNSPWYVLRKGISRHRGPVAAAIGFVLMLALALVVTLGLWRRTVMERDRARIAESQARLAEARALLSSAEAERQRAFALDRERKAQLAHAAGAVEQGTFLHVIGRAQESRAAFLRARDSLVQLREPTLAAEVGLYRSYREYESPVNTLTGHTDGLMAVAWLPDGHRACSASEDGSILVWDLRTGRRVLPPLLGHAGVVTCLAVSPEGRYVLSAGVDKKVLLAELETGREVRRFEEPTVHVRGVAFSPDGRFALWAGAEPGGVVRLWEWDRGEPRVLETPEPQAYYGVAFSPDGQRVLATTYNKNLWIWDVDTGDSPLKLQGHTAYVISAVFSPDGERVLSGSFDQTLRLWDAHTGAQIGEPMEAHSAGVRGVAFLGTRQALSCSMDGTLRIWDLDSRKVIRTMTGHAGGVRAVAVSPDGRRAISGGIDRTLSVWDLARNAESRAIPQTGIVTSLCCSPDGRVFVTGDSSGAIRLYDLATLQLLQTFAGHGQTVVCAAISADGRRLFTADGSGAAHLYELAAGREILPAPRRSEAGSTSRPHRQPDRGASDLAAMHYACISSDFRVAIRSNPDGTMELWDVDSGAVTAGLPACGSAIRCVAMAPDGRHALSGTDEGKIYYWDLVSRSEVFSKEVAEKSGPVVCVAFSADGRRALTGGHEYTVRLWDLEGQRVLREFRGHTTIVMAVGFGCDDRTIFSAGADQTLRMWDAETGSEYGLGAQLPLYAAALAVVPPGLAVLVGSGPSVSLWDTSRAASYLDFPQRLESARLALQSNEGDASALTAVGEWYAFRGVDDWAVELLERARAGGAEVSPLMMARSLWQLGRYEEAGREFQKSLVLNEAPAEYLRLCLNAVANPQSRPAPTSSLSRPRFVSR